jgi:hypothetical protein
MFVVDLSDASANFKLDYVAEIFQRKTSVYS